MSKLNEVLATHQPDDHGFKCQGCTWTPRNPGVTDAEEFSLHVEQAVADAGLAVVVELPAPDIVDPDGYAYWNDSAIYAYPEDGVIYYKSHELTSDEAQVLAASLLAAAKLAGPNRLEAPQ